MGKRIVRIIVILLFAMAVFSAAIWCAARFVYLSPACYPDNKNLTERENYFIRKVVLEAIEYRLSVFADGNADFEAIEEQDNRKHTFVLINSNFMNSVTKDNNGYVVNVQTYFMEPESSDCQYEIHVHRGRFCVHWIFGRLLISKNPFGETRRRDFLYVCLSTVHFGEFADLGIRPVMHGI